MTIDDAKRRLEMLGLLVLADEDEIFADERRPPDPDGIGVSRPAFRILRDADSWTVILRRTSKSFATLDQAVGAAVGMHERRKAISPLRGAGSSFFADHTADVDVLANPTSLPKGDQDVLGRLAS